MAVTTVAGLFYFGWLLRQLGPEQLGGWLAWLALGMVACLADLGLRESLVRRVAVAYGRSDEALVVALIDTTALTVAVTMALALAAMLAGLAFSNSGVALVHALEYPIGVLTHCSHGEGNGLLLPHVMRFNLESRPSEFATIASALGGQSEHVVAATSESQLHELAAQAIQRVEQLAREVGIRPQLRQLGLDRDQLPGVAAKAFSIKRLMDTNPRRPTESDLLAILQAAY